MIAVTGIALLAAVVYGFRQSYHTEQRPIEQQLIGRWRYRGSPVEAIWRPDHTFELKEAETFSGTWQIVGDQLSTSWYDATEKKTLKTTYTVKIRGNTMFVRENIFVGPLVTYDRVQ